MTEPKAADKATSTKSKPQTEDVGDAGVLPDDHPYVIALEVGYFGESEDDGDYTVSGVAEA